jgi:hypothetical protein
MPRYLPRDNIKHVSGQAREVNRHPTRLLFSRRLRFYRIADGRANRIKIQKRSWVAGDDIPGRSNFIVQNLCNTNQAEYLLGGL